MKKLFLCLLTLVLVITPLASCGNANTASPSSDDKLKVVSTIFPQYDWVKNILGDQAENAELTLLLDDGIDLHSYQPSVEDIAKISACDVFIYIGGDSDLWVEDALKTATNKDMIVINLMEVLGDSAKPVDGMEHDHEHEHGDDEEGHGHADELDEHVWLSLKNAQVFCEYIAEKLGEADPENAALYQNNAENYLDQLDQLDIKYQMTVDSARSNLLLFADRFPFLYLLDDYDIEYYAAFSGCSAETEASFETVVFLVETINDLGLKYVMVAEDSDQSVANTIVKSTDSQDQEILVLNSLQAVTADDVSSGTTYLALMEENLNTLEKALN